MITELTGKYYFMSLNKHCRIEIDNLTFKSAATALYSLNEDDRTIFQDKLPSEARKMIVTIPDYTSDAQKTHQLYRVIEAKFTQNKHLGVQLAATKNKEINTSDKALNTVLMLVREYVIHLIELEQIESDLELDNSTSLDIV